MLSRPETAPRGAQVVYRVLLVEDVQHDVWAVRSNLLRHPYPDVRFDLTVADNLASARACLAAAAEPFDALLLDLDVPDGSGEEILAEVRAKDLAQVVIIVSGAILADDVAERVLRLGATDFIGKDELGSRSLPRAIRYSVEQAKTISANRLLVQELKRANEAKSQFLANMSHEIRTPLGIVLGFCDFLLEDQQSPGEQRHSVFTIKRNAEQLSQLVNDLLDLSKIEAERLHINSEAVRFGDLVRDVDELRFRADKKGIELRIEVDADVDIIVTDAMRLRQILVNLIGNAIKFTPNGTVRVHARHETVDATRFLVVDVRDTGIGLTPEVQSRIWEPFNQANATTTRRFGGTGLGLALSRRLARALGGDVVLLTSKPGEGSTFRVSVDAGEASEAAALYNRRLLHPVAEASVQASLVGARILLVEDAPDNQLLVTRILERDGAVVEVAGDGAEALIKAPTGNYDVVLMDMQMPVLDGREATRILRDRGYTKPIVALTAHAMKGEREAALRDGFTEHLTKPIDRKALIETIKQLMLQNTPLH